MAATVARQAIGGVAGLALAAVLACGGSGGGAQPAAQPAAKPAPAAPAPAGQPAAKPEPATKAPEAAKPAAPAAASGSVQRLTMACCASTSSHYAWYVAAAKSINDKVPEVNITVVESGASVENIKRMAKDEINIGQVQNDAAYWGYNGVEAFKDAPVKDIRVLFFYTLSAVHHAVREDSGIKTPEELNGKDFNAGMRGSGTEAQVKLVYESLGIKPKWYVGGLEDAVAAVKDKRIAGLAKAGIGYALDASVLDLQTATPVRILQFSDDHGKKIKERVPYVPFVKVPANSYKGQAAEFWTNAVITGPTATTKLADDLAYKMVKAAVEGKSAHEQAFAAVKEVDYAKLTVEQALSPIHKGALKYYRELGLQIKPEAIGPEAQ